MYLLYVSGRGGSERGESERDGNVARHFIKATPHDDYALLLLN